MALDGSGAGDSAHVSDALWSPDSAVLAKAREMMAGVMDRVVSITRNLPPTASATGGIVPNPTTISSATPCRITFRTYPMQDESDVGAFIWVTTWQVALPYGTDVQAGDTLTESATGRQLTVQAVMSPRTLEFTTRVNCQEVR